MARVGLFCFFLAVAFCLESNGHGDIQSMMTRFIEAYESSNTNLVSEIAHDAKNSFPAYPEAFNMVGISLLMQAREIEAMPHFLQACKLDSFENPGFVRNYLHTLATVGIDQHSLTKPAEYKAVIDYLTNQGSRDKDVLYFVVHALLTWPEMVGFWNIFISRSLSIPMNTLCVWLKEWKALSLNELLDQGIAQHPLCAGNYLLLAMYWDHTQHTASFQPQTQSQSQPHLLSMTLKYLNQFYFYFNLWNYSDDVKSNLHSFAIRLSSSLGVHPDTSATTVSANKIHLGCAEWSSCAKSGWTVVDAMQGFNTHIVTSASRLSMISSNSVSEIYASHILEHLSHSLPERKEVAGEFNHGSSSSSSSGSGSSSGSDGELCDTLIEWRRVLVSGTGILKLSVPDMDILSQLFVSPGRTHVQKKLLMTVMYGGQDHAYNFHKTGFFYSYLSEVLENTGYCDIGRVDGFQLFNDTSQLALFGHNISLNVQARSCFPHEAKDRDRSIPLNGLF